jgi:hypothetical protein
VLIGETRDLGDAPTAEIGHAGVARLALVDQVANGAHVLLASDGAYRSRIAIGAAQSTTSVLARNTASRPAPLAVRPSVGLASPSAKSRQAV